MILAHCADLMRQVNLSPSMEKAFRFIRENHLLSLPPGRTSIDGEQVFVLRNDYRTRVVEKTVELEGHRRYIDIQLVLAGQESIGWAPADEVAVGKMYNPEKDFWSGELPAAQVTWLHVPAGYAAVFFPQDAHAPQMAWGAGEDVVKLVFKVAVEEI